MLYWVALKVKTSFIYVFIVNELSSKTVNIVVQSVFGIIFNNLIVDGMWAATEKVKVFLVVQYELAYSKNCMVEGYKYAMIRFCCGHCPIVI